MQSREEDASSSINVFPLSDDHISSWSQKAYGRSEGEWVQQPQLNREVVGAALWSRCCHQYKWHNKTTGQSLVSEFRLTSKLDREVANYFHKIFLGAVSKCWNWQQGQSVVWRKHLCCLYMSKKRWAKVCVLNPLYVPVAGTMPGKMRPIFCSSSTATSWNLYWCQRGKRQTNEWLLLFIQLYHKKTSIKDSWLNNRDSVAHSGFYCHHAASRHRFLWDVHCSDTDHSAAMGTVTGIREDRPGSKSFLDFMINQGSLHMNVCLEK